MEFRRVFILGFGVSGFGVYQFCKSNNIAVVVYDDKEEKLTNLPITERASIDDIEHCDALVLSPGIMLSHQIVLRARGLNVPILSDLDIYKYFAKKDVKIIGITGSNGKSTTSSLVFHILKTLGKNAVLVGNIGVSPLFKEALEADYCVMEVSSFQSEITNFIFDASILLNITKDHILHHGGLEEYINAKLKLVKNSKLAVLAIDNLLGTIDTSLLENNAIKTSTRQYLKDGFCISNHTLYQNGERLLKLPEFVNLLGEHNLENILASIVLLHKLIGVALNDLINAVLSFKPLEHRIELVKSIKTVSFINDSKATNPSSTIVALKTIKSKNIFLIAGGVAKEEGIEVILNSEFMAKLREVVLIGKAGPSFAQKIIQYNKNFPNKKVNYAIAGSLENAVKIAFSSAKKVKDSVVLLSPLCASFDQFKNYEERGRVFKELVNKIS